MKNDFGPTASLERLEQRAQIVKQIRKFFDGRHFLEVETPLLSHDTVIDRYLQPISVPVSQVLPGRHDNQEDQRLWLQTSPEFGMKRLLAAGAVAVYQICKSFRAEEKGRLHNPEFTMLEWYRMGDDLETAMDLLEEFVTQILGIKKTSRKSYGQVFQEVVDVDPHAASVADLQAVCQDQGVVIAAFESEKQNRDFWLNLILTHIVEKKLGVGQPTIVYDWPVSQSALAVIRDDDPPVAERFELYYEGIEIANGYHELLDPEELVRRNSINNQLRVKDGNRLLPEDSRLLAAMNHGLPACAGVALGVDRLVMLLTGASSIQDVITFPIETA